MRTTAAPAAPRPTSDDGVPAPPDFAAAIRAAHSRPARAAEPVLTVAANATPEQMFAAGIRAAQEARR